MNPLTTIILIERYQNRTFDLLCLSTVSRQRANIIDSVGIPIQVERDPDMDRSTESDSTWARWVEQEKRGGQGRSTEEGSEREPKVSSLG